MGDAMWIGRLMHDFPRVRLQGKAPGSLYRTYKILCKAHKRHYQLCAEIPVLQGRSESWWHLMASRPEPKQTTPFDELTSAAKASKARCLMQLRTPENSTVDEMVPYSLRSGGDCGGTDAESGASSSQQPNAGPMHISLDQQES